MKNNISFVIPCYRSEKTIKDVVKELETKIRELSISEYEIILVNDCSPDNVWAVIQNLCAENNHIKGISLARNFGQHAALLAGYSTVKGDLIVSLDDDGQAPIDELDLLLNKLDEGFDVVYAYYEEIKQTRFRRFGSWMATKMSEIMLDWPKDLKGSSFYVAKKYVINEMTKYVNPYPYLGGLVYRTTHNVACVLTHQRKRAVGSSGYTFKTLLKLWLNGLTAFSVKPIRVGTLTGAVLALIGFIFAIILIFRRLIYSEIPAGWTSTITVLIAIGGLLLMMLGLVGEYVGRIYISINNSPQYVIKEKIGYKDNVE